MAVDAEPTPRKEIGWVITMGSVISNELVQYSEEIMITYI